MSVVKGPETAATLLSIRDAIVAYWLRHEEGATVNDIVNFSGLPESRVRKALRASAARDWGSVDETEGDGYGVSIVRVSKGGRT